MSSPKFAEKHNVVAFLEKSRESDGFADIIDFLKASSVHYALTVNPTIYTSCIEQFWATTKVKTVNDVRQIQALIDKKKLIITKISIRSDLHLEDVGGMITPLFDTMMVQASEEVGEDSDHPTDSNQIPIVDQPSTSSLPKKKQKSKRKQRKEAEVAHDESEHEESVPTPSNDPLPNGEDSMQLNELMEDASKQGRRIEDIDADVEVTLVNKTQERQDEDLMYDTGVLDGDEMFMDATTGEKDEQSTKIDDSTASEAITTAGIEDSAAPTIQVSTADIGDEGVTAAKIDELTLAQTLIEIKAAKPKVVITAATTTTTTRPKARGVVVQEPSEFRTSSEAQPLKSKDKGKAIMIEPEVPLKRKDHVALDEDLAPNIQAQLDAEIIEEERLERQNQEEANIALIESWENT
ncbi:hypothetical protein Tco_0772924 [Tanacetum coccineum]|uniref:Xylulose kinase-1 n=1 Tax=Tanacetum coccineum TaxID=301880 RepID=A0ABQ4ZN54_9ASTR